jgi:hypothetical protein
MREIQSSVFSPLVELENYEQSKRVEFISSLEKGWRLPRFRTHLFYSEGNIYEKGGFFIFEEDGMPVRAYFDTKGIGDFDSMLNYENGVPVKYRLNGLTWERVAENSEFESVSSPSS